MMNTKNHNEAVTKAQINILRQISEQAYAKWLIGKTEEEKLTAKRMLTLCMEQGSSDAMLYAGIITVREDDYENGMYLIKGAAMKGSEEALNLIKEAAEQGNTDAQTFLGRMFMQEGKYSAAESMLVPAAEAGNDEAQFFLGAIYTKKGMLREAVECLSRSAAQGNTYAKEIIESIIDKLT